MRPGAAAAQRDLARLAAAEGGSPGFDRFLRGGLAACGRDAGRSYPGLATWQGVPALQRGLRVLGGGRPDLPVLLAARARALMQFAARLFCYPCRGVLITDLGWPPYQAVLREQCRRTGRGLTEVVLHEDLLGGRVGVEELVERICRPFRDGRCDGLFLPTVSHLGVRVPAERIVRAVEAVCALRFVVLDGAQEFGHLTPELRHEYCDLYLASSHKWLGAYTPLGLGFYGRRRSRGFIERGLHHLLQAGALADPLLHFAVQLEADTRDESTETVNLSPLFCCQGAADDALASGSDGGALLATRLGNADRAAACARGVGWLPRLVPPALRSGILVLQAERAAARARPALAAREAFYDRGVTLTAYPRGRVRLSLPELPWGDDEVDRLARALRRLA
jgi:hypothetical protein